MDEQGPPTGPFGRLKVLNRHLQHLSVNAVPDAVTQTCHAQHQKRTVLSKVVTAKQAVAGIEDGSTITCGGFVGCGAPELLVQALRERFDQSAKPKDLQLIQAAVTGNSKGRGMDALAVEGLITQFIFGWSGNCPTFLKLIKAGKITAWNLPLGIVSHMIRDCAAGRPGPISHVGLGTFVDPREGGGKLNNPGQADMAEVVILGGREWLWYKAPKKIHVALLRGSTADLDGNISFERECFFADNLNQAMAAHNSGGLVIVQVERLVERGSIPTRQVHIPAALVDKVVVAPAQLHLQSLASSEHDGSLSGEIRRPLAAIPALPLDSRKVIAHRCMLELSAPHCIVNLGVGMPEGVSTIVATHAAEQNPRILPVTLSTEVGMFGGTPAGGLRFGASYNADSTTSTSTMIDLIQGGGLDATVLGCAEVDQSGNVNVSKFSGRHPGCGGFIDISQSADMVLFAGTFTSGGLKVALSDGKLVIEQEGRTSKFRRRVQEKTFAGTSGRGRRVLYVTERAVFRLGENSGGACIELIEIAPGVRLEQDVLAHMEFRPLMRDVQLMDKRCFLP